MNKLEFKIEKLSSPHHDQTWRYVGHTYIDDVSLDDMLAKMELRYLLETGKDIEDAKKTAGGYHGNDADELYHQLTGWTKNNVREYVELCRCAFCLVEGCMSVYTTVVGKKKSVIWKNFDMPSRFGDELDIYKSLGPFEFEKTQYRKAVGELVMRKFRK